MNIAARRVSPWIVALLVCLAAATAKRWFAKATASAATLGTRALQAAHIPERFTRVALLPEPSVPEPVFEPVAFPFLDDEDAAASVSVGDTSHGWLVNAKALAENENVGILPRQRERDLAWGTDEMIAMLEKAGEALHRATKTRLWVGDIGRRGGGDIAWSVSHNSGRDADIALAYLDRARRPSDPPDFVALGARGESKDKALSFDAARTWVVVRALLEFPKAQVQHIFLSAPLEKKLLAYAASHRQPAALVARAKDIIVQPGGHDDHLHVRIYCTRRDVGGGCNNTGIVHPFAHTYDDAKAKRVAAARAQLKKPSADKRRAAALRLAVLDAREHADALGALLDDAASEVRAAAATALGTLGSRDHEDALLAAFASEPAAEVKVAILGALSRVGAADSGRLFARLLVVPPPPCAPDRQSPILLDGPGVATDKLPPLLDPPCDERAAANAVVRAAVDAAAFADRLEPVDTLIGLLEHGDATLSERAAGALARITNRRPTERDATAFRASLEKLRPLPRDQWVASGFVAAGYRAPRLELRNAWELVRALPRKGHLAYNAHRALERLTGRRRAHVDGSSDGACFSWLGYLAGNRRKFHLPAPPRKTIEACTRRAEDG